MHTHLVVLLLLLACGGEPEPEPEAEAPPPAACADGLLDADALPCACGDATVAALPDPLGACVCEGGAVDCSGPPPDDGTSEHLPPPYSAAQLRDALPQGTKLEIAMEGIGGDMQDEWTVVLATPSFATMRYETISGGGDEARKPVDRKETWEALRDQHLYPRVSSTRTRTTVQGPDGTELDAWKYEVRRTEDGVEEVKTLWYADDLPGPAVKTLVTIDGKEVLEIRMTGRTQG